MHRACPRVVLVFALLSGTALAQVKDSSRAAARDLGYSGVELFQAGNYEGAFAKLDKAYQVLQAPSLGLWSARALVKLGRLQEAAERLRQVGRLEPQGGDATVQAQAQGEAKQELEQLVPRIPSLVIRVEGAASDAVKLELDGDVISSALVGEPFPVNPGQHRVTGHAGAASASQSVVLAEGRREQVVLRFASAAAAVVTSPPGTAKAPADASAQPGALAQDRSRGWTIAGYGLVGLGVAGVAVGATTGLIASSKKSDLDCPKDLCKPQQSGDVDSYNQLRTISTIGFYAGAALGAAGLVILFTAPRSGAAERPATARLAVGLSPWGASVRGDF